MFTFDGQEVDGPVKVAAERAALLGLGEYLLCGQVGIGIAMFHLVPPPVSRCVSTLGSDRDPLLLHAFFSVYLQYVWSSGTLTSGDMSDKSYMNCWFRTTPSAVPSGNSAPDFHFPRSYVNPYQADPAQIAGSNKSSCPLSSSALLLVFEPESMIAPPYLPVSPSCRKTTSTAQYLDRSLVTTLEAGQAKEKKT